IRSKTGIMTDWSLLVISSVSYKVAVSPLSHTSFSAFEIPTSSNPLVAIACSSGILSTASVEYGSIERVTPIFVNLHFQRHFLNRSLLPHKYVLLVVLLRKHLHHVYQPSH